MSSCFTRPYFFPFSVVKNVNTSLNPFSPRIFPYPSGMSDTFDGRISFTSAREITVTLSAPSVTITFSPSCLTNPDNYEPKPAGEWQTLDVVFRAPKFDAAGAKNTNARFVSVKLNGKEIHKDVDAPKPTGGEISPTEAPKGPILFQGDHGPVAFRNLRVKETAK